MKEFNPLYEYARMCETHGETCEGCPLENPTDRWDDKCSTDYVVEHIDEVNNLIRKWAETHPEKPKKTRHSEFLKLFPKADPLNIIPCNIEADYNCKYSEAYDCWMCTKDYWYMEVNEETKSESH